MLKAKFVATKGMNNQKRGGFEMKLNQLLSLGFLMILVSSVSAGAQHSSDHSKHMAEMNERGDRVMGFSQAKTTHHFRLLEDGGSIEVGANDPDDAASRDQIRQHLKDIAGAFSEGKFQAPAEIHEQTPPGVPVMQELKAAIDYRFEPTENGGRVRITTADGRALDAVHEFLRFQIEDHQTGDPLNVTSKGEAGFKARAGEP
jgi:hypothetical protein